MSTKDTSARDSDPKEASKEPATQAKTKWVTGKRIAGVLSGVCVLSLVVAIGAFGDQLELPNPQLLETGTTVSVAAASADLVCPTPVTQAAVEQQSDGDSEFSNAGNQRTEDGSLSDSADNQQDGPDTQTDEADDQTDESDEPADDFDSDQRVTQNLIQTSMIGAEGSVSFTDLGQPVDVQSDDDHDKSDNPQTFDVLESQSPSSQTTIAGLNSGLVVSTDERSISDPDSQQFTAATQSSVTTGGDTRGIAATTCSTAATEHWLVGGGTSLGTSSKLVVQNPSRTPASVAVTVWGPSGRVPLAGQETLLIPAGKQVSVFLEGIAAEQRRTAVHVESTGTLVAAYLQVNALEGITAKGIDYVTPGNGPSHVQVMTGVVIQDPEQTAGEPSAVRLVVPDFSDVVDLAQESEQETAAEDQDPQATAEITLLGDNGRFVLFGADEIELTPGAVTDVDLTGVPDGAYSVVVNAEVPVLAAARASVAGEPDPERPLFGMPEDFTWIHSSGVLAPFQSDGATEVNNSEPQQDIKDQEGSIALSPVSVTGAVATVGQLDSSLIISALPNVESVEELVDSLERVPRFYASDVEADTEQGTAEELALREAWKQDEQVSVTTFSEAGQVLVQRDISIGIGQTRALALVDFGGAAVAAVLVESGPGSVVDWAVVSTSSEMDAAMSTLQPVTAVEEPLEVRVTRSLPVGLK